MKSAILISLAALFFSAVTLTAAVKVDSGVEGLAPPMQVDAPMAGKKLPDNLPPGQMAEPSAQSVPGLPATTDLNDKQHLKEPADDHAADKPAQADFPTTTGAGQVAAVEQKGKGSSTFTANADGRAELTAFLPTYRPARIIARLLDSDGEEIFFKGQSLLIWERPDDKAFAPIFFRGESDSASMKKVSGGNYDAVQNVYGIDIKQGQKLRLEISGQPESNSVIKVNGPLTPSD